MINYVGYVVVVTEFMCELFFLWIFDFMSLLDIWTFKHEHELMKGMNDLGCLIAMIYDWYMYYNMFDCGDTVAHYSISVMSN